MIKKEIKQDGSTTQSETVTESEVTQHRTQFFLSQRQDWAVHHYSSSGTQCFTMLFSYIRNVLFPVKYNLNSKLSCLKNLNLFIFS